MDARPLRPEALLVELGVIVALWALVAGTVAAFDRPTGGPRHCSFPTSRGIVFAALNYQFWRPSGRESLPGIISIWR